MQSKLTRRAVLAGVPAVAFGGTFTAITATAVLAGASDARIFALAEEHDRAFAEMHRARDRWCEAAAEKMPPHLRQVPLLDHKEPLQNEAWHAVIEACEHPEVWTLIAEDDSLKERCRELVGRLSQTKATTLKGVCTKMRIAIEPGYRNDDIVRSVAADLERLAGGAA